MKHRPAHRDGARLARLGAVLAVLPSLMGATPAMAAACIDEVRALARDYALVIDPPDMPAPAPPGTAQPLQGTTSEDLARSGGVIEPPPTGDQAVIEPPETGSAMPTVPDVAPDEAPREGEGPVDLSPSDKVIFESVLQAARAEAERGEEEGCFERLKEARAVLQRQRQ